MWMVCGLFLRVCGLGRPASDFVASGKSSHTRFCVCDLVSVILL